MNRIKPELDEQELRRICSVLEGIANRQGMSSEEIEALETAAVALMAVTSTQAIQRAYTTLANAHNGIVPEKLKADLRNHGIDFDYFESANQGD